MIIKQSCVEIVPKLDFECQNALLHLHELVALVESSKLLTALYALACFDSNALARDFQHFARRACEFAQPRAREVFVDARRRLIFLDVQTVGGVVDGGGVFGKVRVINAPAFDAFALRALVQMTKIFVDTDLPPSDRQSIAALFRASRRAA